MIINREKRITTIKDGDLLYKIPTTKFDDIIGTSDGILPEDTGKEADAKSNSILRFGQKGMCRNFAIELDGRKFNLSNMIEFADMDPKLFVNSLSKASSLMVSDEYLVEITSELIGLAKKNLYFTFPRSIIQAGDLGSNSQMNQVAPTKSLPHIQLNASDTRQTYISLIEFLTDSKFRAGMIDNINAIIRESTSFLRFMDKSCALYSLPIPTEKEIFKGISEYIISRGRSSVEKKSMLQCNTIDIINLKCDLQEKNSIELLDATGRLVVKTVPEVLPDKLMHLYLTRGRNGMASEMIHLLMEYLHTEKTGRQNLGG